MGIQTLPNGMEFFSLSEELEVFTGLLYQALTPINIGIIVLLTMLLIGMIVFMVFYMANQQLREVA